MWLALILGALAGLSLVLLLWQWWAGMRLPLHHPALAGEPQPGMTVLKPLKGMDSNVESCLRSWFEQSYGGPVQLLFGVASAADPIVGIVRKLILEFPAADAQLIVCKEAYGVNAKVSTLIQLGAHIRHPQIVVSDADVEVPADLLQEVSARLADPKVCLTHCLYRLVNPSTAAMHWESIAINADFWSQVLQSRMLAPLDYALGAVMGTTLGWLERIGGFTALADYLADDYQIGHRMVQMGGQIDLNSTVVNCWSLPMNWRAVWDHQLRWARTIRFCKPLPYALSLLSNATFWPLLWTAVQPGVFSGGTFLLAGIARWYATRKLLHRFGAPPLPVRLFFLPWLKDLLQVGLWIGAFAGNQVEWRGDRYRVESGGRLVRLPLSGRPARTAAADR